MVFSCFRIADTKIDEGVAKDQVSPNPGIEPGTLCPKYYPLSHIFAPYKIFDVNIEMGNRLI